MAARVQEAPFDPGAELNALIAQAASDSGAVASFTGVVRGDRAVTAMTLEHYPAMTGKMLARIADEARRRWDLKACLVIHRVGRLTAGEAIVFVGVIAAHREAAFAACAFVVDYLKTRAPFWKREHRAGGDCWVAARAADQAAAARWAESR